MLWAISYLPDKPNTAETREKFVKPHREYLQSQKHILVLAGATQTDDGSQAIGSLFVVNVDDRSEAKAVFRWRPVYKSRCFFSITIVRMRKGQWNPQSRPGCVALDAYTPVVRGPRLRSTSGA